MVACCGTSGRLCLVTFSGVECLSSTDSVPILISDLVSLNASSVGSQAASSGRLTLQMELCNESNHYGKRSIIEFSNCDNNPTSHI